MTLVTLTTRAPDALIDEAINNTIQAATALWSGLQFEQSYPTTGFGIADLRPKDLAIGDGSTLTGTAQSSIFWGYSFAAASTWYDIVNVPIHKDAYVLVTGIFDLMTIPLLTNVKPTINGVELPINNVEELYAEDKARAWFSRPMPFGRPSTTFKISAVTKALHSLYWFGFLGYTIAKRSYLIAV